MKESEEKLNSDFDLKVKHDLTEKLKSEPPAPLEPSPILSTLREKKNPFPLLIGIVVAVLSLVANVFLLTSLLSSNSEISVLKTELTRSEETISDLRSRLNNSEK